MRKRGWMCGAVLMAALVGPVLGQKAPENTDPVKIVVPTVDKEHARITIPAAFWNEKLADWVEVAVTGRPSDFLHETLVCMTTTRAEMEKALRAIGCQDADVWVGSGGDFARMRGDRLLILVEVEREGRKETYSLDELLAFRGWGVSVGPYGFMFKGDPEGGRDRGAATMPAEEKKMPDRLKILRDDPQVGLVFKGLQSMSQSFADHPLAYDDWIYKMPDFVRNTAALGEDVFNSNGDVKVTLVIERVGEEQLLKRSAAVWHEKSLAAEMLKLVKVAQGIDRDKAEWLKGPQAMTKPAGVEMNGGLQAITASLRHRMLGQRIARGYATLDAAWATWAAGHLKVAEGEEAVAIREQARRWAVYAGLKRTAASEYTVAAECEVERFSMGADLTQEGAGKKKEALGRGVAAQGRGLLADNAQVLDYWAAEEKRLSPDDPRTDWVKNVKLRVALATALKRQGEATVAYGEAVQKGDAEERNARADYEKAAKESRAAQIRVQLAVVAFEIAKREGLDGDAELPRLREKENALEKELDTLGVDN